MEKEPVPLGSAPPLPPHPAADMLDLFMSRYDYDYNRDPDGTGNHAGGSDGHDGGDEGDGLSGAVRNRPPFALGVSDPEKDTTYRVDYTDPHATSEGDERMRRLVDAAYSVGPGRHGADAVGTSEGDGGVFVRDWYTLPGAKKLDPTDISTYKTDYTHDALEGATRFTAPTNAQPPAVGEGMMYPGAPSVPYNADFLTVKGGAKEDDGADIAPKITSIESLKPKTLKSGGGSSPTGRDPADESAAGPSAAAAARYLMSNACAPWVPGNDRVLSAESTGTARDGDDKDASGDRYGQYSCESWLYGDTSLAHPSQLPQGFAGSARAELLDGVLPGSVRTVSSTGGAAETAASLLRRLAGQTDRRADKRKAPLSLFSGNGGGRTEDETNPIYITPAEQRKCASRHRIANEGYVKGMTVYASDYVDQGRLPELPGNAPGPAQVRDTNTNARPTVGEMTTGTLTADARVAAALRNSHGTMLSNERIVEKAMSMHQSQRSQVAAATTAGEVKAAAALTAALPPPEVVDMMRGMERSAAVDKADPHRRKLH